LVPFSRLSWLNVSYWVHVDRMYPITSFLFYYSHFLVMLTAALGHAMERIPFPSSGNLHFCDLEMRENDVISGGKKLILMLKCNTKLALSGKSIETGSKDEALGGNKVQKQLKMLQKTTN